jgi:hypothetical protein
MGVLSPVNQWGDDNQSKVSSLPPELFDVAQP